MRITGVHNSRGGLTITALALLGCIACGEPTPNAQAPNAPPVGYAVATPAPDHVRVGVHAIWPDGGTTQNRELIDAFFECLIHNSTYENFWGGRVDMTYRGSKVIARPSKQLTFPDLSPLLTEAHAIAPLPHDARDDRSVYVVFASGTDISLRYSACGRVILQDLDGIGQVSVAFVRNDPLCWPTQNRLRTETQIGMHELTEATDRLLGDAPCTADGACEGRSDCGEGSCDNLIGLACEGAPVGTYTGCDGGQVDGWVIQTLTSAGRQWDICETCTVCDFTPRLCASEGDDVECEGVARER